MWGSDRQWPAVTVCTTGVGKVEQDLRSLFTEETNDWKYARKMYIFALDALRQLEIDRSFNCAVKSEIVMATIKVIWRCRAE